MVLVLNPRTRTVTAYPSLRTLRGWPRRTLSAAVRSSPVSPVGLRSRVCNGSGSEGTATMRHTTKC